MIGRRAWQGLVALTLSAAACTDGRDGQLPSSPPTAPGRDAADASVLPDARPAGVALDGPDDATPDVAADAAVVTLLPPSAPDAGPPEGTSDAVLVVDSLDFGAPPDGWRSIGYHLSLPHAPTDCAGEQAPEGVRGIDNSFAQNLACCIPIPAGTAFAAGAASTFALRLHGVTGARDATGVSGGVVPLEALGHAPGSDGNDVYRPRPSGFFVDPAGVTNVDYETPEVVFASAWITERQLVVADDATIIVELPVDAGGTGGTGVDPGEVPRVPLTIHHAS